MHVHIFKNNRKHPQEREREIEREKGRHHFTETKPQSLSGYTLPKTNSSPLEIGRPERRGSSSNPYFWGATFVSGRVNWLKHIKSQDLPISALNKLVIHKTKLLKTWWFRRNILNDWYNELRKYTCICNYIYVCLYFPDDPPTKSYISPVGVWYH